MSLLIQFLIVSILPLSFVWMGFYAVRHQRNRVKLARRWLWTLLAAAVWSSSLLSLYLGIDVDLLIGYNWRIVGRYALSLMGVLVLLTTLAYLSGHGRKARYSPWVGIVLWVASIVLDPAIAFVQIPPVMVADLTVRQFDIWALLWISSWLIPLIFAWMLAERINHSLPPSLYRNQAQFWFTAVSLLAMGGALAFVRDLIALQQVGAIILLVAALVGTYCITRDYVPDLQVVAKQFFFRVARGAAVFLFAWLALVVLTRYIANVSVQDSILVLAAALFALLILAAYAIIDWISHRFSYVAAPLTAETFDINKQQTDNLLPPSQLAEWFAQQLKRSFLQEQSWIMTAVDGPGGRLILRPLVVEPDETPSAIFSGDNPFVTYLRQNLEPLTQQDIDSLNMFATMADSERQVINSWQRFLYVPICIHNRLIGIIGLQKKSTGESYHTDDFSLLQHMAEQFGYALVQAQNLALIQRINAHVFGQNRELARENRRLAELVHLHGQFTALMSPELRQPFTDLKLELLQIQNQPESEGLNGTIDKLQRQTSAAQSVVDNLIAVASHLEKQTEFSFAPLYIDSVIRSAIKNLETMADARRITIELDIRGKLLPVWGDEQRLEEAIQQVLHNALKFNKLNSIVVITCEMKSNEIRVQIIDHGVGIPPNRMEDIWSGMQKLFENEETGRRRRTRVGLPLTRFIVQSHGGRIEARSTYGMGSTFTIYLPALLSQGE